MDSEETIQAEAFIRLELNTTEEALEAIRTIERFSGVEEVKPDRLFLRTGPLTLEALKDLEQLIRKIPGVKWTRIEISPREEPCDKR